MYLKMSVKCGLFVIQWNSSGKARDVSLKLRNLVHFHAPLLQIMFILPLMTGHLFWKATILGDFIEGFYCIHSLICTCREPLLMPVSG